MKSIVSILFLSIILILQSCITNECPPDPLTDSDIAGYIDGSTGILFTTAHDKTGVLESLNAIEHSESSYRMPIYEIGEQQVFLVFRIAEVEHPSNYVDYQFTDYCYSDAFQTYENELLELIEINDENLEGQFIIACGDLLGQLGDKEEADEKNVKGKEKEALDKLGKKKQNKKELKKELAETAKQKGKEAKEALNNDDKEGAKEKAKELVDETKFKFDLKYGYDFCDDWKLKLKYGHYWTEGKPQLPPTLLNEFTNANIRYKVYKDAECGPGLPTIGLICFQFLPMVIDTTLPPPPAVWTSQEYQPRDVCLRGAGFCVEQEVVVLIEKDYSDDSCKRLVAVRTVKDFACFK